MRAFVFKALSVFAAMTLLDVVFALYIVATAGHQTILASSWAVAIQLCSTFVTVSYVGDRRLISPCLLGAFTGTWLALTYFPH